MTTGFDVGDRNQQLGANHSGSDCGVYVAINDHPIGPDFQNDGLESSDDLTGLLRVRTRPDLQVNVRSRHRELLKEDIGHVEVVMLAGVNQRLPHMIVLTEGLNDRRGFHEVRPRSDYMDNVHIENSGPEAGLLSHYLSMRRSQFVALSCRAEFPPDLDIRLYQYLKDDRSVKCKSGFPTRTSFHCADTKASSSPTGRIGYAIDGLGAATNERGRGFPQDCWQREPVLFITNNLLASFGKKPDVAGRRGHTAFAGKLDKADGVSMKDSMQNLGRHRV